MKMQVVRVWGIKCKGQNKNNKNNKNYLVGENKVFRQKKLKPPRVGLKTMATKRQAKQAHSVSLNLD